MSDGNHLRNSMLAIAAALTIACTAMAAPGIPADQAALGSALYQTEEDVGALMLAQSKFGARAKWKGKDDDDNYVVDDDDDADDDTDVKRKTEDVRGKSKCPPGQESVGHGRYAACMIAR
jgi:hypothetical protein